MLRVNRCVIIPYTPEQMFNLVNSIESYDKYLPWCTKSSVKDRTETDVIGTVYIEYLKVKMHFVTKNHNTPYSKIDITLVEGPFKELYGSWSFAKLGDSGCKITFDLNYKFSNFLLEKIFGPVFTFISKNIVDCFVKEAYRIYGTVKS